MIEITKAEWEDAGRERYGEDMMEWKFRCPACGFVMSMRDYKEAGGKPHDVGQICIGRLLGEKREAFGEGVGPCNYAGFGLIQLSPVKVDCGADGTAHVFDFADSPLADAALAHTEKRE